MTRKDKYGRGSAAANGEGFVDLVPGDTFAALEGQLKRRIAERFDNPALGISASIGSKRNASELAKHLASGEEEEAHKFAAKNIGALFVRGRLGVSHDDKKAIAGQRWITRFVRVFTPFRFAGNVYLATLTLKDIDPDKKIYAVEAVEINQDAKSGSTPRGAMSKDLNSAPFQDLTSQLRSMVAYYVDDVNRTHPNFVGRVEPFTVNRTVELLENLMSSAIGHQPPTTSRQPPTFSIIIPVYNVAPYLRECLDSVLAQTNGSWEAICVDDGSTDGSGAILDEYAAKDNRFRVIHQVNAGVSAARNVALDTAKSEWILFLDGDDIVVHSLLQELLKGVSLPDVELLRFRIKTFKDCESFTWGNMEDVSPRFVDIRDTMGYECGYVAFFQFAYRRDLIGETRFEPFIRGEDVLFSAQQLAKVNRLCDIKFFGYGHRVRPGSAMQTMSKRAWLDEFKFRIRWIETITNAGRQVPRWLRKELSLYVTEIFGCDLLKLPKTEYGDILTIWCQGVLDIVCSPVLLPWSRFVMRVCLSVPRRWVFLVLCQTVRGARACSFKMRKALMGG